MKNSPYIRQVLILLVYILLWIPNAIIAPLLWMLGIVNTVRERKTPFLIWFVNTDEPTHVENNYGDTLQRITWGILNIEEKNVFVRFWWYCKWNVVRNSYFYFKMYVIKPKELPSQIVRVITNTTGRLPLHLCNYEDRGKIHTLEKRDDTLYFRYSFTEEIRLFWFFGKRIWNVQLGVNGIVDAYGHRSTNRYLFKSKMKRVAKN